MRASEAQAERCDQTPMSLRLLFLSLVERLPVHPQIRPRRMLYPSRERHGTTWNERYMVFTVHPPPWLAWPFLTRHSLCRWAATHIYSCHGLLTLICKTASGHLSTTGVHAFHIASRYIDRQSFFLFYCLLRTYLFLCAWLYVMLLKLLPRIPWDALAQVEFRSLFYIADMGK